MIEYLKRILKDSNIEDIYLTGGVDIENGIAEFYHDLRCIYFEINSKYIEFESIDQFSKLRVKVVDSVTNDYEMDEDMTKAKTSISQIILNDTMSEGNYIVNIVFYNLEEQEELICGALEMELANGQVIFLDPSFYFGINVGGKKQKQMWRDNLEDNTKVTETCIKLTDR